MLTLKKRGPVWELACLRLGQPGSPPYTENRATIEFRSTANRDNSWLAALV
ncbi:hypothetical protein CFT9_00175 [Pseudomonas sp. CFT9]|nr:hypothetical protein CFT9_00175 [Pseudomonas sp. CFT9]